MKLYSPVHLGFAIILLVICHYLFLEKWGHKHLVVPGVKPGVAMGKDSTLPAVE